MAARDMMSKPVQEQHRSAWRERRTWTTSIAEGNGYGMTANTEP
jgi:hypothetical protein